LGFQGTASAAEPPKELRVGIIGLDTSHAVAFTQILNDPQAKDDVSRCRVVAAYPKGSPDIVSSTSRVPAYTEEVKKHGVEIVESIEALLTKVDVVLLETNDGRPHLEQVLPCLKAGKPVFLDKPIAGSLTDAVAIFEAARHFKVPVFSSSSLRFSSGAQALRRGETVGEIKGCDAYSPCSLEATHPDLFWYGIHGVETLFTVMGPGCESVTRLSTPAVDLAAGVWKGNRIGTFRGIRSEAGGGSSGYGGQAFGTKGIAPVGSYEGYRPLLVSIVQFFRDGKPPVTEEETLEIYAFMEAADESKRTGGAPVKLATVLEKARTQAAEKLKPLLK
jgi:predicted dehydrogenase